MIVLTSLIPVGFIKPSPGGWVKKIWTIFQFPKPLHIVLLYIRLNERLLMIVAAVCSYRSLQEELSMTSNCLVQADLPLMVWWAPYRRRTRRYVFERVVWIHELVKTNSICFRACANITKLFKRVRWAHVWVETFDMSFVIFESFELSLNFKVIIIIFLTLRYKLKIQDLWFARIITNEVWSPPWIHDVLRTT